MEKWDPATVGAPARAPADTGYEAVPSPAFHAAANAFLEADRHLDSLLHGDPG